MAMKCQSCGGTLIYDVESSKLKCQYCESSFNVDSYKENNAALKMDTYVCKNCGAELHAPEEQIVSYCMYCGNEATLLQKADSQETPVGIIPFKYSKEYAKKQYADKINKYMFVPKEFKNPDFIEGFRGIYIPYWKTKATLDSKEVILKGVERTTQGDYDYTRYYDCKVKVDGSIDSGCYDSSEAFDDTISNEIAPFYADDIVPFNEGYLAGFYADKATVPAERYDDHASMQVLDNVSNELSSLTDGVNITQEEVENKINWNLDKAESILLPVWFLTWRKGNRVAYSVMNGQTGKLFMDIPVDYKKFFAVAAVVIALVSVFLSLIPAFVIPLKVAAFSVFLMYVSGLILNAELKKIRIRENHVYDWGMASDDKSKSKKLLPSKYANGLGCSTSLLVLFLGIIFYGACKITTTNGLRGMLGFMLVLQVILAILQCRNIKAIASKFAFVSVAVCTFVMMGAYFIADVSRQNDFWYYGISIASLLGMILNCITSIFYMNYLSTRPVPNFFTRKGAKNEL